MDLEKLKQFIAQLDEQIAKAPNDFVKNTLQKTKNNAQAALDQYSTVDKMGNLSDSLLNPNSQFYQNYASYLQKTQGGIGVNSLLAPLMAGGTGYAGGQAIAQQQSQGLMRERQDKINTSVQQFALGNINTGANLLGQQGNLQLGYANLNEQKRQYDDSQSGSLWKTLGGLLGAGLGTLVAPGVGTAIGAQAGQAVAGYGG